MTEYQLVQFQVNLYKLHYYLLFILFIFYFIRQSHNFDMSRKKKSKSHIILYHLIILLLKS